MNNLRFKKFFLKSLIFNHTSSQGFSLIELIVVITMLAVLFLALILTFNPATQYNKANDAQREHDLGQMQRALDSYFNDTGCYPTSLTFGLQWSVSGQVYMEKVPQDPNCTTASNKCYVYEPAPGSCPQWSVLYAALRAPLVSSNSCPLVTRNTATACLPVGYSTNNYNYCVVSGVIDCSVISGTTIVSSGGGGGGGGGTATPTPTPSLPASCPNDLYFGCTGDNRCNSIAPKTQCVQFGGTVACRCDQHCNQTCQFN